MNVWKKGKRSLHSPSVFVWPGLSQIWGLSLEQYHKLSLSTEARFHSARRVITQSVVLFCIRRAGAWGINLGKVRVKRLRIIRWNIDLPL